MLNRLLIFAIIGALVISLSSCDRNRYFEQNIEIDGETWSFEKTNDFVVHVDDTVSSFNFYLNLRNTNDYPFANLYVFIETTFPDSLIAKDTIELQLADLQGKWIGTGNGKYKYNNFILRERMRFVQKGDYKFGIKHGMREDELIGISDVGVRLEYSK